ncbi:hypothetical protein K402DRAFT_275514 [Aulographum hederae CBS 113979]|uniref:Uncharacterized protein n=1 Tax=Aulographum hederae CBS 113979 TaxID=1176131 RepID=A0A6G1GID9_9PEZI|nr:hypothetical protein K402DRAFT_275514 [Aulographum hederae CBS 113979]
MAEFPAYESIRYLVMEAGGSVLLMLLVLLTRSEILKFGSGKTSANVKFPSRSLQFRGNLMSAIDGFQVAAFQPVKTGPFSLVQRPGRCSINLRAVPAYKYPRPRPDSCFSLSSHSTHPRHSTSASSPSKTRPKSRVSSSKPSPHQYSTTKSS